MKLGGPHGLTGNPQGLGSAQFRERETNTALGKRGRVVLMTQLNREPAGEGPEDRIRVTLGGAFNLNGSHFLVTGKGFYVSAHGHDERLKAKARGKHRGARVCDLTEPVDHSGDPGVVVLNAVPTCAADQQSIDVIADALGMRVGGDHVEGHDGGVFDAQPRGKGDPFFFTYGVVGVTSLEEAISHVVSLAAEWMRPW